jgi:hypothetical protein
MRQKWWAERGSALDVNDEEGLEAVIQGAIAPVPRISTKSGPFSPGEWLEFLPRSARGY